MDCARSMHEKCIQNVNWITGGGDLGVEGRRICLYGLDSTGTV
jgi:hypothetical protein